MHFAVFDFLIPASAAADERLVNELRKLARASEDWSLSLQVFFYLQVLDVLTTWVGFRMGLGEASPFIQLLMQMGPMTGVLCSKLVAVALGAFCVWRGRFHVIHLVNYWYAALVIWNLALIVTR